MQGHGGNLERIPQLAAPAEPCSRSRERSLIAASWLLVVCAGTLATVFARAFLPEKFALDALIMQSLMDSSDLWDGLSFDGYVNTARLWWLVFHVVPHAAIPPLFYGATALAMIAVLRVIDVQSLRYHLLAGTWLLCSSLFLTFANKEMVALPIALWLCLARSAPSRIAAGLAFLLYAAFFRQYWAICFFYFIAALAALRLQIARHGVLALAIALTAYVLPFVGAAAAGYEPLTDARTSVNADRVDSPDARSAFNNTFENSGAVTDIENAALAWPYINIPVVLASKASPQYVMFAILQLCTLWFFAAGCASFLKDARRIGYAGSTYLRCCAFVIAYSLTQAIFEPDFGSFLRHEVILMVPMLIVAFYRAHAKRAPDPQPMGFAYGRNVSAYL
jgi:hypothetical protein